jgi:hypothetical protein
VTSILRDSVFFRAMTLRPHLLCYLFASILLLGATGQGALEKAPANQDILIPMDTRQADHTSRPMAPSTGPSNRVTTWTGC